MAETPGILTLLNRVNTAPLGVASLMRWRVKEAFADRVDQKLAAETSRSARDSVIRSTAARKSRFDDRERSMSDDSAGSLNLAHQVERSAAPMSTVLVACAAGAVDEFDHCAGTEGVGRVNCGPTVHPSGSTVSAIVSVRRLVCIVTASCG